MKKYCALLVITVFFLGLTACSTPQRPDLNGFHYIFNEDWEYIWLGMERRDVERNLEVRSDNKGNYAFFSACGNLVTISFDENNKVDLIIAWPEIRWFLRDGIALDASRSEIEQVFGENHQTHSADFLFQVLFSYDHTQVPRANATYFLRFLFDSETQEVTSVTIMKRRNI